MFGLSSDGAPLMAKSSSIIKRPPEDVFGFVGERFFENYPRWSPEVVELMPLSDGPVGVGTMARQVRVDQGRRSESTFKVSVYQPYRRICFEGVSHPYRCDYSIEGLNANRESRLTFEFVLLHLELYMRPFEKLIRVVIQDGAERTVRNLKRLIEIEAAECIGGG
jgi:hypothetical protein